VGASLWAPPGAGNGSGVPAGALLTASLSIEQADHMAARPLIAGNWKMNGLKGSSTELQKIIAGARDLPPATDLLVCPPATLIAGFAALARGSRVAIGAQDCHAQAFGAFTGDISAEMLADAGASAVIVGHSERRSFHHETDAEIRAKALAARRAGLLAVVCVGETRAEREAGHTIAVVGGQLAGSLPQGGGNSAVADVAVAIAVAYEPVWAIGTGLIPSTADVAQVHGFIRRELGARYGVAAAAGLRILYGGSVKPANAGELMGIENVDGALVGGASLKAEEFLAIAAVYR
jgi:triosephosphate isomerase